MKRIIKSARSPFKSPDETWDNYIERKAKVALKALDEFCFIAEDNLDKSLYIKLDEARGVLKELVKQEPAILSQVSTKSLQPGQKVVDMADDTKKVFIIDDVEPLGNGKFEVSFTNGSRGIYDSNDKFGLVE